MKSIPFAVVIPAFREADALGIILTEWVGVAEAAGGVVAVGLNGPDDGGGSIVKESRALCGRTDARGYGHGCQAAIAAVAEAGWLPEFYLFVSADGANDPKDLHRFLESTRIVKADLVLGQRLFYPGNFSSMGAFQWCSNLLLGLSCLVWCGKIFCDIGPFRLIRRTFYESVRPQEMEYGYTMETQVAAVQLGARVVTIPVAERRRIAGVQKVSGGSFSRRASIGWEILCAGARTSGRLHKRKEIAGA